MRFCSLQSFSQAARTSTPGWRRTTVGFVSIALVAASSALAFGEAIRIVSPSFASDTEGNSSVTPNRHSIRTQFLIPASDFADLPPSHRYIVGFNFRSDSTQTQSVDYSWPHEQMWMSTTNLDSLTNVFDDNHGPDKKMVFDGEVLYPLSGTGLDGGPRDFVDGPRLNSPFFYDPSLGNLLIEQRDYDRNYPVSATIDVVTMPLGRLLINDPGVDGTYGELLPSFPVLQFEFALLPGDFNLNGVLDVQDIDLLTTEASLGKHLAEYDLNGDARVDILDVNVWIKQLADAWVGDANLDGEFNSGDLVEVLAAGTYAADVDATWSTGDFNASGKFDSGDLIAALADGGYGQGPRLAAAVPEPSCLAVMAGLLPLLWMRSRNPVAASVSAPSGR